MRSPAAMSRRISSKPRPTPTGLSNRPMRLTSTELRPADWPEGRQMAPDRIGSVRGLTRRSFHRIAFTDWGPASAGRPVLCVHGLTRNGRDFDHLAAVLAGAA